MRSLTEIQQFATSKGMVMEVRDRGTSYRAGGDIIVSPDGFDWRENECSIKVERRFGWEGTGYDGRGRSYDLWIIVPPKEGEEKWKRVEYTSWLNVEPEKRLCIGNESEQRSGCDGVYFIHPDADRFGDLEDLFAGWTPNN